MLISIKKSWGIFPIKQKFDTMAAFFIVTMKGLRATVNHLADRAAQPSFVMTTMIK